MRDKILARLKEKFPGVNLSKKRLDAIADKLTPKIKEESEIDAKLDDLNDVLPFADMAKEDDKIRTLEAKLKEKDKPKPTEKPAGEDEDTEEETQEEQSKPKPKKKSANSEVLAMLQEMRQELQGLKAEKMKGSMQSKRKEKLKDVDESFYDMIPVPESEDDLEEHVEQIQTRWNKINDGKVAEKLATGTKPINGAAPSKDGKEKQATKEELDKVMPNIM